ncbi:uncharacterized protein LACBIDRAFT_325522 [Laccaria bicolor S238N-H82]|uniref:Predicted protein n=1 Tax=Laccaria bicolor (strain S238N-H82 / ATCC MYA-4686) TaxID=486041 RepID=B0D5D3_LACBS|nr:uncharacterized protein LACBIDRAFT_325522 [Laccaria bicolor S238N-H82]EDR09754.1 predicted protein [Laccaria bicolor S238N-H82]|eukprot:XP_001879139.1 predicted protein [Laccaria bicolor S238N-H82]
MGAVDVACFAVLMIEDNNMQSIQVAWVEGCDQLEVPITAAAVKYQVTQHRLQQGSQQGQQTHPDSNTPQPQAFSQEAFFDALVEWIVADDQSLNVIDNPQLRQIFLMLREDLRDSDIPHGSTICAWIIEVWEDHLDGLEKEMKAFLHVLERIKITLKIGWVTLDNTSNNDTFMITLAAELRALCIPFDAVKHRICRCVWKIQNTPNTKPSEMVSVASSGSERHETEFSGLLKTGKVYGEYEDVRDNDDGNEYNEVLKRLSAGTRCESRGEVQLVISKYYDTTNT